MTTGLIKVRHVASTEESKITESIIMTFSVERKWKARIMKSRKQIRTDIKTEESN